MTLKRIVYKLPLVTFCLMLVLSGCNSINPAEPKIPVSKESFQPSVSSIQLPIIFQLEDLEELINTKIPDTLYQDLSYGNHQHDNLKVIITKSGEINLAMSGNQLDYTVPLKAWVQVGTNLGIQTHTDFALALTLRSELAIKKDWKLDVKTELQTLTWLKKPKIKIAFFKVGIAKVVERLLHEKLPAILPKLDSAIAEKLPLKQEAEKIWTGIQKPIRINKKVEQFWLNVDPEQVNVSKIDGRQGNLQIDMQVQAFLTINPGQPDTVNQLVEPLPSLNPNLPVTDGFHITLLAKLPFEELNRLVKSEVQGHEVMVKDYSITLKKLELKGGANQLYLKLKVGGATKGTLYLTGVPTYDSLKKELKIKDFDFDVNTANLLVGSADWLLHDDFRSKVQDTLHLPIESHIEQLPMLIENGVAQSRLGNKLNVSLSEFKLASPDILVNNKEIQLKVIADGKIKLELEKAILSKKNK